MRTSGPNRETRGTPALLHGACRTTCVGFLSRPYLSRRTNTPQQMRRIVSDHAPALSSFVAVVGFFRPCQARTRTTRCTSSSPTTARAWICRPVTTTSARASRAAWPRRRRGTCSLRTAGWEWMDTASRLGMHGLVRERGRVHQVLGVPGGRIGAGHHEPRWCLSLGRMGTVACRRPCRRCIRRVHIQARTSSATCWVNWCWLQCSDQIICCVLAML
jgi:hypothetical protein